MKIDDIILKGQEVTDLSELSGGLALEDELLANVNIAFVCECDKDAKGDNINVAIVCRCVGGRETIVTQPGGGGN